MIARIRAVDPGSVTGDNSYAAAGVGNDNTATVSGDNSSVGAAGGSGNTATVTRQ